jgi:hypothetical protein
MTGGRVEGMRMLYLVGSLGVLPRDPRATSDKCSSTTPFLYLPQHLWEHPPTPGPLSTSSAVVASSTVPHLELYQLHCSGTHHILLHLLSVSSYRGQKKLEFLPDSP